MGNKMNITIVDEREIEKTISFGELPIGEPFIVIGTYDPIDQASFCSDTLGLKIFNDKFFTFKNNLIVTVAEDFKVVPVKIKISVHCL